MTWAWSRPSPLVGRSTSCRPTTSGSSSASPARMDAKRSSHGPLRFQMLSVTIRSERMAHGTPAAPARGGHGLPEYAHLSCGISCGRGKTAPPRGHDACFKEKRGDCVAAYIVAEIAETDWSLDPVEGLTAAKYHAAARAKEVGRAVVVRDCQTGLEVARFSPSNRPEARSASRPPPSHRRPSSDALIRLRAANQRLQALVGSQSRIKKDSDGL